MSSSTLPRGLGALALATVVFGSVLFGGGCVANEAAIPSRGVVVSGPPPAPIAEERPIPPGPQAAWVTGYWHWTGMHYAWIPGHWENAPPGSTWAAPQYGLRDGAYFYEPGTWRGGPSAPRANAIR